MPEGVGSQEKELVGVVSRGGSVAGGVRLGFVVGVAVSTGSGVSGVLVAVGVIPDGIAVFVGVAVGTACWRTFKPTFIDPGFPFAVNFTW